MKITYINPNSTEGMTESIVATARSVMPELDIVGLTNNDGPAAIQGKSDGDAAVPGMLNLLPKARRDGADVIVIACFDDTGLEEARTRAGCPVLGIGQSSFVMAQLLGLRFSVITSLAVSIPVIEENIHQQGFRGICASVRASGLPVLTIDEGGPDVIQRIVEEVEAAVAQDGAACAVLGCAGMARIEPELAARASIPVIEGVAASARLAQVVAR
ncbi:MAG: aspartate/glutamate racemase family protein [Qipengyuania pacifica]